MINGVVVFANYRFMIYLDGLFVSEIFFAQAQNGTQTEPIDLSVRSATTVSVTMAGRSISAMTMGPIGKYLEAVVRPFTDRIKIPLISPASFFTQCKTDHAFNMSLVT